MAGFQVDLSPLERSSRFIGQSLASAGQDIGNSMQQAQQKEEQQKSQGEVENLLRQSMSGDPEAFKELMVKSPQAARMVAEQLQNQKASQQGDEDRFQGQMAEDTAGFIEQMHLAPEDQQESMFTAAIKDPRYDIDEEDRPLFMDVNARKAIIGKVKGKEYAESFFGSGNDKAKDFTLGQGQTRFNSQGEQVATVAPKDTSKFKQGTGIASGMAFNESTGEFTVNQELKDKLDAAKVTGELDVKTRQSINKDFTTLTSDTKLIRNTAQDLSKLATMNSGPASIAMVFKFMKALDPTSVVRESEFATAENSAGVPEAVRNTYNKLMNGEKLGDKQIAEFVATAKGLSNSAITSSEKEIDGYLNTFENTLTPSFKKSIRQRIPKRFDVAARKKQNTPDVDLSTLSLEELKALKAKG